MNDKDIRMPRTFWKRCNEWVNTNECGKWSDNDLIRIVIDKNVVNESERKCYSKS